MWDAGLLRAVFSAFAVFLALHVAFFRLDRARHMTASLAASILLGLAVCVICSARPAVRPADPRDAWLLIAAACLLYGLLVFNYGTWIFGMGEAALRVRLLYEVEDRGGAATVAEVLDRYNASLILDRRLEKLVASGHLTFDGARYLLARESLRAPLVLVRWHRRFLGLPE